MLDSWSKRRQGPCDGLVSYPGLRWLLHASHPGSSFHGASHCMLQKPWYYSSLIFHSACTISLPSTNASIKRKGRWKGLIGECACVSGPFPFPAFLVHFLYLSLSPGPLRQAVLWSRLIKKRPLWRRDSWAWSDKVKNNWNSIRNFHWKKNYPQWVNA